MHAIYDCGQLFASIQLFGQIPRRLPTSFAMAAQADHQTTARIQDFMSALHEAKAEWGFAHMLIAQAVLRRPIHLAQPVEGQTEHNNAIRTR